MNLLLSSFLMYCMELYLTSTFVAKEIFLFQAFRNASVVSNCLLENLSELLSVMNVEILLPLIRKTLPGIGYEHLIKDIKVYDDFYPELSAK